jgi:hypothetical protein
MPGSSGKGVVLRDYPYPYRSAIAISNDCEFTTWDTQIALSRFLCGEKGLDLEISNSLFFFVTNSLCHSTFSYFQGTSDVPTAEAPVIREMVRAGYIDTVHAYGDFDDGSFKRLYAERVAKECREHGLRFAVWTNHGSDQNWQNLGHRSLARYQQGDNPQHPCYHLDLLRQIGVRYFWVDDGYLEKPDDEGPLLYDEDGRDGSSLQLFRRYRGLAGRPAPNASSLPDQVRIKDIEAVIEKGRACIVYQHLGCWRKTDAGAFEANRPPYFTPAGVQVLEYLAQAFHDGRCLVTTVARLLRYLETFKTLAFTAMQDEIVVSSSSGRVAVEDLAGVSFYASNPDRMRVVWRAKDGSTSQLATRVFREPETNQAGLGVPWTRLERFRW